MSIAALRDRLHTRLAADVQTTAPISKRRKALWLALAGIFLAGPLVSHLHKSHKAGRPHGDWYSIYTIATYSIETGELEADENDAVVRTQRYPPITRPLIMLMGIPPKTVSAVLSFVLFAGLYGWCAWQVAGFFLSPTRPGMWAAIACVLGLVSPYIWADLTAGNVTSILLASVTGAYVLGRRGRFFAAGVVLSIGIMLKIIPVLCLLYFLVRRRWRVAWGVAAGILFIGVLPSLAIFGPQKLWDYHGYWYHSQFSMYTPMRVIDDPIECTYQNQAVVRTMARLFTPTNAGSSSDPFYLTIAEPPRIVLKVAYFAIMAVTGLALLFHLWRRRNQEATPSGHADYALCVGSMLWFSPWIGSYYYSLALWPAAALLGHILRHATDPAAKRWAHRALLVWLLAIPAIGSQYLRACGIHTWATALLLCVLPASVREPVWLAWYGQPSTDGGSEDG